MKKILLGVLLYLGLLSNAIAAPAIAPYFWNVWEVASTEGAYEDAWNKTSTTNDHGGTIQFSVFIKGGWTYTTLVTFNGSVIQPFIIRGYDLDYNDNINDTWVLYYEVYGSGGTVEVKDYDSGVYLKDRLYIR